MAAPRDKAADEDCRPPVETRTPEELGWVVVTGGSDEEISRALEDAGLTGKPKKK